MKTTHCFSCGVLMRRGPSKARPRVFCAECRADKVTAQKREYYAKNRDKVAAQKREYYAKNRDKVTAQKREYYAKNRDKVAREVKMARRGNVCWECGEEMTRVAPDHLCGACRAENRRQINA